MSYRLESKYDVYSINHKCKILINIKGKHLKKPFITNYDMMDSSMSTKQIDGFVFLGEGECVSFESLKDGCRTEHKLSGKGYFFKRK